MKLGETPSEYFYYDETSPSCLRWKVTIYNRLSRATKARAGRVAGTAHSGDYAVVTLSGTVYYVHRLIWEVMNGPLEDGEEIDHFDGNRRNNKVGNLRKVSSTANSRNFAKFCNNTSGVTGVVLCKGYGTRSDGWKAQWTDLTGKRCKKRFSIAVYGNDEAHRLASKARGDAINALNAIGAGYTDRHGKEAA